MKKLYKFMVLIYLLLSFPLITKAQTFNVNPDFWTATDALGRKTMQGSEAGSKKDGKYVGMFYWTWHTDDNANFSPVINVSKALKENPLTATTLNDPAWHGYLNGGIFWWDEPLLGYYRTTDDWVLRKHAQMLANAGVDVVFFDCTNGNLTWKTSYTELMKVWEQARKDGVNTPQIAFILNFSAAATSLDMIDELYTEVYQPGLYKDLWFMWNGKPLIMAYPEMIVSQNNTAGLEFKTDSSFTAVDAVCPSWGNNIGNLTMKLYKWDTNYSVTTAGTPIADSTFVNFGDNQRLILSFKAQPAGTYYWELSDGTEIVGVWKWNNNKAPVVSFYSGRQVSGNYMSAIYYANGSSANLTNDDGSGQTAVQIPQGVSAQKAAAIKNFFTFRPGQPDYVNGPKRTDQWGWLELYPQHGYVSKTGGGYEQMTVGVGQNAIPSNGGHASAFNRPDSYGRSYTKAKGQDTSANAYLYGLNFQEQWDRAHSVNPDLVFVTGWNEWIAGRWDVKTWPNPYAPFSFVDEYNWEKSRDIEPVKSWGVNADNYYMQLVNNVRKYKGMDQQASVSTSRSINLSNVSDWQDVKPEYKDYKGDIMWRNAKGQGDTLVYYDSTGRNDIVTAKVARDTSYLYFYVETAGNLTKKEDADWMSLWIDADRNKATGWEGYDFVINRTSPGDSATVESSVANSWNWAKAGSAAYYTSGNVLVVKIPRAMLNQYGKNLDFEFKWSDNCKVDGNIMNFYTLGDAAPDGRFNYVYTADNVTEVSGKTSLPWSFSLSQNFPNPFNPATEIKYSIAKAGMVNMKVYNMLGQEVASLVNQEQKPGNYEVNFDASKLASGVYLYKIQSGSFALTKKMLLLK